MNWKLDTIKTKPSIYLRSWKVQIWNNGIKIYYNRYRFMKRRGTRKKYNLEYRIYLIQILEFLHRSRYTGIYWPRHTENIFKNEVQTRICMVMKWYYKITKIAMQNIDNNNFMVGWISELICCCTWSEKEIL